MHAHVKELTKEYEEDKYEFEDEEVDEEAEEEDCKAQYLLRRWLLRMEGECVQFIGNEKVGKNVQEGQVIFKLTIS